MTDIHHFTKLKNSMVLILCAIFFLLCSALVLSGASLYTQTVAASNINYLSRTALSYLVNQVRQGDRQNGGISITTFGDGDALCIREIYPEGTFETLLYCHEGQLLELFMEEGTGLSPEDGTPLLPLDSLELTYQDDILTVTVTPLLDDGGPCQVSLFPRCPIKEVDHP